MSGLFMRLLATWLINALALLAIPYLMHSVSIDSFGTALIVAVVLRPLLVLLTLPATVMTMGLFIFVINGLLFWGVANMVDGFHVAGFWAAVGGALLYSVISWTLSTLLLQKS